MLITRKKQVPLHWVFYAQLPFVMAIAANYVTKAPFVYAMKKFIDNPAAITFLLSIEVFVTVLGAPLASWLSDRVWTKYGRRKPFIIISNIPQAISVFVMPFAPNLMTLIAMRWMYGIFADIGAPNQALTMEVVPSRQRGMGAGFFNMQLQFVNLVFFGVALGRFDDIYFTGPFMNLFDVPGETLIFFAGGIMLLAICFFTWFGMHEVKPPTRMTLNEGRHPEEGVIRYFFRSFFGDIFHKSLLPLYLLLTVSALVGVKLGFLGPLLYTDQWGYSLQQMGRNFAIGAVMGIFISVLAGYVADRTSKMKVYSAALVAGLLSQIGWTIFVALQPDQRPGLNEILFFGMFDHVFGLIAASASYPLILEYVERNRLGTAGAGMNVCQSILKNGFNMIVGPYVLVWSLFFLPQAGDVVDIVMRDQASEAVLRDRLQANGLDPERFHLEAMHRPGVDDETSQRWRIRRSIEEAGDRHKRLKEISSQISQLNPKLVSPYTSEERKAEVRAEVAELEAERRQIEEVLQASAASLRKDLVEALGPHLVEQGNQILNVGMGEEGSEIVLDLAIVEPVRETEDGKGFPADGVSPEKETKVREDLLADLERSLHTLDLSRVPTGEGAGYYEPRLEVQALEPPVNGVRVRLYRDPDFVRIERALIAGGVAPWRAFNLATEIIAPIRGGFGQSTERYRVENAEMERLDALSDAEERARLRMDLHVDPSPEALSASVLEELFSNASMLPHTVVSGAAPNFALAFDFNIGPPASAVDSDIRDRLAALVPEADEPELDALGMIYRRVEETAAARPVYLTVARPVVLSDAADREYDYFFSVQYLVIITDIIGIGVIILIVHLERRGVIRRYGAEEDLNR